MDDATMRILDDKDRMIQASFPLPHLRLAHPHGGDGNGNDAVGRSLRRSLFCCGTGCGSTAWT